jgi:hypothetical protein
MINTQQATWSVELVYLDDTREVYNNVEGVDVFQGRLFIYFANNEKTVKAKEGVVKYTAWINK